MPRSAPSAVIPTAHQHVRETIRHWILSGELTAGTRLRQTEIAARTGASTTPVREALRELTAEGLVTMDAHRGAVVRSVDLAEMTEIYDLRCLLEPHAVAKAVGRISADEIADARALIAEMSLLDDPAEWALGNRDFHAILVDAGGSVRLSSMIKGLRDAALLFVGEGARSNRARMRSGDAEHALILDAVGQGNAELAAELTLQHLQRSLVANGVDPTDLQIPLHVAVTSGG